MKIRDLLATKGDAVETIAADATIRDVVERLTRLGIGALVVTGTTGTVDGIISERDVVRVLGTHGDGALGRRVADEMSTPVTTSAPDDEVTSLMSRMTERRIRHLPVVEAGRLVGIVSIGDVVKSRVDQLERDRKELLEYVSAR
ncbi:MAG TPA: CBS domain-containing protein [Acidimicrobiales bacterium]|jgi:CBS domain-containing protein|nr:CBS domain-containing protein [Acidimicrobiales bacterium]